MIARTNVDETERLLYEIEDGGSLDGLIAAMALLEAEDTAGVVAAWDAEVAPLRGRLPASVMDNLCDLLLARMEVYVGYSG